MKPEIRFGILASLLVCLSLIISSYSVPKSLDWLLGLLNLFIVGICIYQAIKGVRGGSGSLTFGQGFRAGMFTAFITAFVAAVVLYVFYKFVYHDAVVKMYELQLTAMQDRLSSMPEDQRSMAEKITRMFVTPGGLAVGTFIRYIVIGLILSLIMAGILKRDEPPAESHNG